MSATPSSVASGERTKQVWARLATVIDPELDEPVTELGFVTSVEVAADGRVSVAFRLPTYWCAANFAYLMAADMRAAVASLSWVTGIGVSLDEHMYADEINRGMAENLSFQRAFGDAANDELDAVRQTFLVKAFQRRQEALLSHLLAEGHEAAALLRLTIGELGLLSGEAESARLIARYMERRHVCGPTVDEAEKMTQLAFVDSCGAPIDPDTLGAYLRGLRRVGVNAEFNSALCRGLLAARYGESAVPVEEKPVHFFPRTHDTSPTQCK
jgi:metal-sulfur cluster biosynthetic enzyme